ncbi:MAG: hypothetical protein JKY17_06340 [Magnetovibrio sp.]|nr:hypothetical protein [Magnetovibrio sp.]
MDWLSENWILLAAISAMGAMHLFGHKKGGGGCCGGGHNHDKSKDLNTKIDVNKSN